MNRIQKRIVRVCEQLSGISPNAFVGRTDVSNGGLFEIIYPEYLVDGFRNEAKPLFIVAQCSFRCLAPRYIYMDNVRDLFSVKFRETREHLQPAHGAIFPDNPIFVTPGDFLIQRPVQMVIHDYGHILGMYESCGVGKMQQFLNRVPGHGGEGFIAKNNASILNDCQALKRVLHQHPVFLFGFP